MEHGSLFLTDLIPREARAARIRAKNIFISIYYESKRIRKISVTLSFTPWGDRQTVFYYGEKHTLYTIIYDITACEDVN